MSVRVIAYLCLIYSDASVQPPGLLLFKDRRTGSIESSVDLRQIVNFNSQPMKKGREAEFDLMLADSAIKLRSCI